MSRLFSCAALGLLLLASAACQRNSSTPPPRGSDDGTLKVYRLEGTVVRLDDANHIATLRHGPVQDDQGHVWMEAMTMDFPVVAAKDWEQLKIDRRIRATVYSRQSDYEFWLRDVQPR